MIYKYALTHRPPQPGAFPTEHLEHMDAQEYDPATGIHEYGHVHYTQPLTRRQVERYELTESPIILTIVNIAAMLNAYERYDKATLNHLAGMMRDITATYAPYHWNEDGEPISIPTNSGRGETMTVTRHAIEDLTDMLPEPTNWMMTFLIQGEPAETFAGLDPEKITDRCAALHDAGTYPLPR